MVMLARTLRCFSGDVSLSEKGRETSDISTKNRITPFPLKKRAD